MKLRNLLVGAALLVSAAACKSKEESAVEDMVEMIEAMASAAEAAGDDCGKMAAGLEQVAGKYDLAAIKRNAEGMKGDEKKVEEMMKKYGDRMQKAMPKMMAMAKCSDDPKMQAVQAKFKGMM